MSEGTYSRKASQNQTENNHIQLQLLTADVTAHSKCNTQLGCTHQSAHNAELEQQLLTFNLEQDSAGGAEDWLDNHHLHDQVEGNGLTGKACSRVWCGSARSVQLAALAFGSSLWAGICWWKVALHSQKARLSPSAGMKSVFQIGTQPARSPCDTCLALHPFNDARRNSLSKA